MHALYMALVTLTLTTAGCSTTDPQADPAISFVKHQQIYGTVPTFKVALGDLDDDGDLDAVFANMAFNASRVLLNDGQASFTNTDQELTEQGHGIGIGDLDGDDDLDLFFSCAGYEVDGIVHDRPSRIYLNDGEAHFTDTGQDLGDKELSGTGVYLHDIDTDGDLDAHVNYYQSPTMVGRIYLNDGSGSFTLSQVSITGSASWGDLDGDGDLDLMTKVKDEGLRVLLNDGSGFFNEQWSSLDPGQPTAWKAPVLGDLDGDGDLDAFDADGDQTREIPARIWFNDGSGQFTPGSQEIGSFGALRPMLADLDGDSDLDALLIQSFGDDQIWLNDGTGSFEDSGLRFGDTEMTGEPAIGDLNGDGLPDLFIPWYGSGGPNEVWLQIQP
ncbi:FG-GAP repeat domain-containing protein [Gemmatimonadota bacterium]